MTKKLREITGDVKPTLAALIKYLFVSLFKACAGSLAAVNGSCLKGMEWTEKNIDKLLDTLSRDYQSLRQSSIDEQLFDIAAGFESLKSINLNELVIIGQPSPAFLGEDCS